MQECFNKDIFWQTFCESSKQNINNCTYQYLKKFGPPQIKQSKQNSMDGCQFFTTELFTIMDTQYFDLKQNV